MHREDKNFGIRDYLSDLACSLEPVQFGHADIKDGNIGFQFYCLFYRFPAVRCLADDSPAALRVEESPVCHAARIRGRQLSECEVFSCSVLCQRYRHTYCCATDCWNQYQVARRSASLAPACWRCRHQPRTGILPFSSLFTGRDSAGQSR